MLDQIERDLKTALLAGDRVAVDVLKSLKTAAQYEAVAKSVKPAGLNEDQLQAIFAREAKKRQEAAELYQNANEAERASKELAEKVIIDKYLPEQMSEQELAHIVEEETAKAEGATIKDMGRIIGAVRARVKGSADGALIAKLVKQSLGQE